MRSRYSAYALNLPDYIARTWHSSTRPALAELHQSSADAVVWKRLAIMSVSEGGPFADQGTVEFRALGSGADGRVRLHETSRFVRESGNWVYLDGQIHGD